MQKRYAALVAICAATMLAASGLVLANDDHQAIEGPFETPMDVTTTCLECHEDAAKEVMATTHWTWEQEQVIGGKKVMRGKKNAFNNFCISVKGNWPRCTSCHVGYGWKDDSFDFTDESRVDCLACHDTTGTYNKGKDAPAGAGMPPGYTGKEKFDKKPVDLVKIAQNVGAPTRTDCLNCHANGGGGNNVKHGDIDQSLIHPTKEIDVHMAEDGNNFTCQKCHASSSHMIPGNSMVVSPAGKTPIACTDCHDADVHKGSKVGGVLKKHTDRVACQTCHIPFFAKKDATKMDWDWSKSKNPKDLPKDKVVIKEHGHKVYIAKKGKFIYQQKVVPTYAWYNGMADAYQVGEKIDPTKETLLNYPLGSKDDPEAKIAPFKKHTARQVYDAKNMYLILPKIWPAGKDKDDAYWKSFDWNRAAKAGGTYSGLEYSGEYAFAPTATFWPTNHQVSPASEALRCNDCHGPQGRLDWKALGYADDPKKLKKAEHK